MTKKRGGTSSSQQSKASREMSERIETAFRKGTPVDRAISKAIRKAVLGTKK